MKKVIAIAVLFTGSLWAQKALEVPAVATKSNGPSYSQQFCAGFIAQHALARTNYVVASKDAPHADQFGSHEILFLGGPGLREGERYSVVRQVLDPNIEDSSPEQRKKLARLGKLYDEVGWVTVQAVRDGSTIATLDFVCDTVVPGDILVPYQEKPKLEPRLKDQPLNQYAASSGVTGHILGSKGFVGLLGTGSIVYMDFGAARGAKVGDYLYIRRGYADSDLNKLDQLSDRVPKGVAIDAANPVKVDAGAQKKLPPRVLGEIVLLNVGNQASTGMILRAFAEVQLGDGVEVEATVPEGSKVSTSAPEEPCKPSPRWKRAVLLGHKCK